MVVQGNNNYSNNHNNNSEWKCKNINAITHKDYLQEIEIKSIVFTLYVYIYIYILVVWNEIPLFC